MPGLSQEELNVQLIQAAWANDLPRAGELVETGADVNWRDDTVQSAYLIATSEGYLNLLAFTLDHGADVNLHDSYDGTGLIRAADRGHADIVGRLLRTDIDANHINNLGWTALHEAIILGDGSQRYLDTVRLLVAGGVDLTMPSQRDGIAPLQHAERGGYDEIATTLRAGLGAGAVSAEQADADLLAAASAGDADGVAVALRQGAQIETRDDQSRTPLLLAALNDRLDVARILVHLGADPNAMDNRSDNAWLVTGVTGSVAMAELLLTAHPDLTLRNRFGGTSLIPASERGHVDYVRRVAHTGVNVNHVNDLGWTALLEAVILGDGSQPYQKIVRILLDTGADSSIADKDGVTALEHARAGGQQEIARILSKGS